MISSFTELQPPTCNSLKNQRFDIYSQSEGAIVDCILGAHRKGHWSLSCCYPLVCCSTPSLRVILLTASSGYLPLILYLGTDILQISVFMETNYFRIYLQRASPIPHQVWFRYIALLLLEGTVLMVADSSLLSHKLSILDHMTTQMTCGPHLLWAWKDKLGMDVRMRNILCCSIEGVSGMTMASNGCLSWEDCWTTCIIVP